MPLKDILFEAVACNCIGDLDDASATEKAILQLVADFGGDIQQIWQQKLSEDLERIHYNSIRKKMSTIIKGQTESEKWVHLKGAAELVVNACEFYLNDQGEKLKISNHERY